jgi:hypothetical protein
MRRQCGDCQLCCKLVPVQSINKPAGTACRFQKFHKGCTVYRSANMPFERAVWNCRWLVNDDTADLPRPDRAHYVIDLMPDYVTHIDNKTGEQRNIQVVQIWVDPKRAMILRYVAICFAAPRKASLRSSGSVIEMPSPCSHRCSTLAVSGMRSGAAYEKPLTGLFKVVPAAI